MNTPTIKAYVVLSVTDLRKMLAAAEASYFRGPMNYAASIHCAIIHNINVEQDTSGNWQISSNNLATNPQEN